jgi:hypothetical protein
MRSSGAERIGRNAITRVREACRARRQGRAAGAAARGRLPRPEAGLAETVGKAAGAGVCAPALARQERTRAPAAAIAMDGAGDFV